VTAGCADLVVDAGAGFSTPFIYCEPGSAPGVAGPPIDVTGWHAALAVRSSYGDGISVMLDDESMGGITVGTTDGSFIISMTAEQTSLLPNRGVYDLLVTPTVGEPIRLVQGSITATPAVTP